MRKFCWTYCPAKFSLSKNCHFYSSKKAETLQKATLLRIYNRALLLLLLFYDLDLSWKNIKECVWIVTRPHIMYVSMFRFVDIQPLRRDYEMNTDDNIIPTSRPARNVSISYNRHIKPS